MTDESKRRIIKAALKEFAQEGFGGARVERIAREAGVNKAMIFYYFSSKQGLYHEILAEVMGKVFGRIWEMIDRGESAENFLTEMPKIYIRSFEENPDFIKVVAQALIQGPDKIQDFFRTFFKERFSQGPRLLQEKIRSWYENGEISEKDPMHFLINVISLSIFVFIGRPVLETIFDKKLDEIDDFYGARIDSVVNLLKRGMLK